MVGQVHIREWEDDEGNKRTSTEIQVDEVGPSLRWAQAQIERTEREKPSNENRQASSGGGSGGGGTSGHGYDFPEEEPFVRAAEIGDL